MRQNFPDGTVEFGGALNANAMDSRCPSDSCKIRVLEFGARLKEA